MRHFCAVLTVLALLLAVGAAWAGEPYYAKEYIFLSDPVLPSCHASSVIEAPGGDLLCTWYAGEGEGDVSVAVVLSRKAPGAATWTPRVIVADDPLLPEGNPVLWADPTGKIWLFFVTQLGDGWVTAEPRFKTSSDDGHTWSDYRLLSEIAPEAEVGWMYRNHPIVLSDGTWLLPMYDERDWTSMVLLSTDHGASWQMSSVIGVGGGYKNDVIQPTVIERDDGTLYCLMRKSPKPTKIYESYSSTGGWHWTTPTPSALPNPNAAVEMIRLANGHVVLAYNDSAYHRRPLSVALSTDEGRTWLVKREIEIDDGVNSYSYPSLCQSSDGLIHLTYTWRRDRIAHVEFNEEWLLGRSLDEPLVNVLIPNGGEAWSGPHCVAWTAIDFDGDTSALRATVMVSRDNGSSWSTICSGVPNIFEVFGVAPFDTTSQTDSRECLVKVVVTDADGLMGEDVSDAVFCVDNSPPYTARHNPRIGAVGVPVDSNIYFEVRDDGAGVDSGSIVVTVDGSDVTASCAIAQIASGYSVTYTPPAPFSNNQVVEVGVDAADVARLPNVMAHLDFSFTAGPPPITVLSSGYVTPASGGYTTAFTYRVKYWDTGNRAPDQVWCAIWWGSRGQCFWYPMWAYDPADTDYVDGKWFTLQMRWLDSSVHALRFAARRGGEWVYWPSPAGSYRAGPSVAP